MTLDEAIQFCTETAADYMGEAMQYDECDEWEWVHKCSNEERATNYRQIAKWLKELKEAKRLLRLAVAEFKKLENDRECRFNFLCEKCPLYNEGDNYCKWRYTDEAEKLLGEEI